MLENESRRLAIIRDGARTYLRGMAMHLGWVSLLVGALLAIFSLPAVGAEVLWLGLIFVAGSVVSSTLSLTGQYLVLRLTAYLLALTDEDRLDGLRYRSFAFSVIFGVLYVLLSGLMAYGVYQYLGLLYLLCYISGACFASLFIRVAGGVFTNAADMGDSLVQRLSEQPVLDDSNVARVLNQFGEHVSDIGGFAHDAVTSLYVVMLAGVLLMTGADAESMPELSFKLIGDLSWIIPGLGIFSSVLGGLLGYVLIWRNRDSNLLMNSLYMTLISGAGAVALIYRPGLLLGSNFVNHGFSEHYFVPLLVALGVLGCGLIGVGCEWYTSTNFRPLRSVLEWAQKGPALTILAGFMVGLRSTFFMVLVFVAVYLLSYWLGGYYGFFVAALGLALPLAMIVALNAYGALTHFLHDLAALNPQLEKRLRVISRMDMLTYTTTAVGKGFLGGLTFFTSLALFHAAMAYLNVPNVQVFDVAFMTGVFLGAAMPYAFSALLLPGMLKAVGGVIDESFRQLRDIPYLKEAKANPDVIKATRYTLRSALQSIVGPGLLVLGMPLLVGWIFDFTGLTGLMIGALISSFFFAFQYGNTGGALGNVKHYVEKGYHGGPGTPTHRATLVADTFGDALKDSLGPAMNVMVKLLVLCSLLTGIFMLGG